MSDLNRLVIQGRIVRNASIRMVTGEKKVADFSIANNYVRKKSDGEYENVANFFNVSAFVNSDNFVKHLAKGQQVIVEGSLRQDRWEQEDGQKRSPNNIAVSKIHLVFPKKHKDAEEETVDVGLQEDEDMFFDGDVSTEDMYAEYGED